MTIHVSATKDERGMVFKVDGQLKADDVEELTKVFQLAEGASVLDLSELQSADDAGLETLRELVSMGAEIRHASPYIQLLLKTKS